MFFKLGVVQLQPNHQEELIRSQFDPILQDDVITTVILSM